LRFRIFSILLLSLVFSVSAVGAEKSAADKAKAVIAHYKKNVYGIILKGEEKVVKGRIRTFKGKGIVFDPQKSGPFYNPKPRYFPMSKVQAFVDAEGKVLWGNTTVKPRRNYLKIRRYRFQLGGQYGVGRHQRSYTFEPIAPDGYDYVQELQAGKNIVGKAAYFIAPKYSVGFKYVRHQAKATLYGLQVENGENGAVTGTIKDNVVIQSFMLDFGLHHAISRFILLHADIAAGALSYSNDRQKTDGNLTISSSSFCAMPSVGIDFLVHRNIAVSFDVGFLFGSIKEPTISDKTQVFKGQQSMDRFDIGVGVNFYL
jgi:hypothetical protein